MNTKILSALILSAAIPASVFAAGDMDSRIESAAKNSYNYKTVLHDEVTVRANDGVVTLTGTVDDKSDKNLAQDTVENLPGVVRVDNQIVVSDKYATHSDGWIALKIRSSLLVHANVSAANTQVMVNDGVVTLTGKADNTAQKDLTEVYAKEIDNVKSVTNDITVVAKPSDERTVGENIDDASITSQVKLSLLGHRSSSAVHTKVETKDGIVTLSGTAASDAEKSLDGKLAESVRGVRSVVNDIEVKS